MGLIGLAPEGSPWPFWFSSAYLTQTLNRQSSIGGESPEWPNVTPPHKFRYMRVWRRVTDLMTISVGILCRGDRAGWTESLARVSLVVAVWNWFLRHVHELCSTRSPRRSRSANHGCAHSVHSYIEMVGRPLLRPRPRSTGAGTIDHHREKYRAYDHQPATPAPRAIVHQDTGHSSTTRPIRVGRLPAS